MTTSAAAQPTTPAATQPVVVAPKPPPFVIDTPQDMEYIKALFYADYGVGKTHLAGSAVDVPDMNDVMVVDAESGGQTLRRVYRDRLERVRVTNYKQFARVHEYLRLHCRYRDEGNEDKLLELERRFKPGKEVTKAKRLRTVILDSLTEINKMCMYSIMGITVGDRSLDIEPDTPQWAEWGKSTEMTRLLVRSFRDLPMHVIFVCSEGLLESEQKKMLRRPNLPGKLGNEVQGFLDLVGYLVPQQPAEDGTPRRRLMIQPGPLWQAKNRLAGPEVPYLDQPTMSDIYRLVNG